MRNLKRQIKEGAEEVSEALIKFVNLKRFYKMLFMGSLLLFINVTNSTPGLSTNNDMAVTEYAKTAEELYVDGVKQQMEIRLINEVDTYIKKMAPNSRLSSENIVEKCIEYDTDVIFVLSQALLESHFGTKGKAVATNSVWNVGTYDNGQILYRYGHPDESLEPYLKLVNEKYLITVTSKGDTLYKELKHLVRDRGYTNYDGRRFASAKGYENGMRKLIVEIDMETSIGFYQEVLTLSDQEMLAYFKPTEENEKQLYALN